ncbi:DctP family TRAP transporter solute-binding subunit [Ammoniphilus sp. 3BR4]|uniref:TRAP transporter substrate-binding protein n=1 Tax=Ammoniphilus sp. 3BR4 TaxID=3158265 RepID=UPI0034670969
MKKRMILSWVLAFTMIVAAGCGGTKEASVPNGKTTPESPTATDQAKKAEFVFKLGHLQGGEHPYQTGSVKFKELVEGKSDGRIQIDIFPSSQLGNQRDIIEGLQMGTVQLHVGSVAPVANFAPKLNVLSLPYLFRDKEHAFSVLDGEIGKELAVDLEAKGIKNLAYWENGWRHLTNATKPIKSAADASGLKIRIQESPAYISYIKALGSTPTPIPFGELYTALEQKVVDGSEGPLAQLATNKFHEVSKHLTLNAHTYDAAMFLVSIAAYDKLPADLQRVITEAALEAGAYERQLNEDLSDQFLSELRAGGMVVEENPDMESFRKAVEPVYQELQDSIGKDLIEKIRNVK